MQHSGLLSAAEAARQLEVRLPTLYAYVSRGLLRSVPGESKGRRLYFREDVERLRARHQAHGGHAALAAGALRWGEPVLDSALTDIGPAGPRYRGWDAVGLAEKGVSFEGAAELLWTGTLPDQRTSWPTRALGVDASRIARLLPRDARPLESMAVALPTFAVADPGRHGASPPSQLDRARRLIRGLAAALALPGAPERAVLALREQTVAESVLVALGLRPRRRTRHAIDQALVLCADHELNPSAFAARVAASTGADLYACVGAALAALSGPLHGGACDRIEMLVAEAGQPSRAAATLDARLRRGDAVPGFGHPLYAHGDPRGRLLLESAQSLAPRARPLRTLLAIAQAMRERGREGPTLDTGLVALASALGLPPGTAVGLFAVGRAAGWIAHALEQEAAGFVLRPRARYVGPPAAPTDREA
jgi:citrate synthase